MIGSEKIFFDSSPFVYLVENHPKYYLAVASYVADKIENNTALITSVITLAEFFVKPKRDNDTKLIQDFIGTLKTLNFTIQNIDLKIAGLSADLRAQYHFLKGLTHCNLPRQYLMNAKAFLPMTKSFYKSKN